MSNGLIRKVKNCTKEIQEIADSKNLTFDAGTLLMIAFNQYEKYHSDKLDEETLRDKADYACCKLNELLEIMIGFYGGGKEKYGR